VEWGASFHEIIDAIRNGIKAKNQRRSTVNAIGRYDRWEEMMESAGRKMKKAIGLQRANQYVSMVPPPTHRPDRAPRVPISHRDGDSQVDSSSEPVEPKEDDGVPKMPVRRKSHDSNYSSNSMRKAAQELVDALDMVEILSDFKQEDVDEDFDGGSANGGEDVQPPPSLVESSALSEMSHQDEAQHNQRDLLTQGSFMSYDSKRPTELIEVDVTAESCDTSLRSSFRSLQSGLTLPEDQTESYWEDGEASAYSMDSFGGLVRDTSHWMVGGMDAPRILRCHNPTVISEDGVHDETIPPVMANWQYQGFGMQPPPYSNTIINRWT
jgi:hypothetical protein